MSIWQRIVDQWQELSWQNLFGVDPAGSTSLMTAIDGVPGRPAASKQVGFTIAAIALAAKMAKADGTVTESEIAAFHRIFRAPPEEQANIDFFFKMARRSSLGADNYARQIVRMVDGDRPVLEDMLDALLQIARADGRFDPEEDAYLRRIATIFGLSPEEYQAFCVGRLGPAGTPAETADDDPYVILGVSEDADDDAIRERWRALVKEHHPDRAIARGLGDDDVRRANERLARINAAYRRLQPGAESGTA
jgi:DnaJ like chaperone protein